MKLNYALLTVSAMLRVLRSAMKKKQYANALILILDLTVLNVWRDILYTLKLKTVYQRYSASKMEEKRIAITTDSASMMPFLGLQNAHVTWDLLMMDSTNAAGAWTPSSLIPNAR